MKNIEHNNFDQHFKDTFEGFEQRPDGHNWSEIRGALSSNVDQLFNDKLGSHEAVPSQKVWNGIQKQLPLSLLLRRHLNTLSKVAAIVLIGMVGLLFIKQNKLTQTATALADQQNDILVEEPVIQEKEPTEELAETVLEIQMEDNEPQQHASDKHAIRDKELKMAEDLLADLLSDPDEFLDLIDEEKIEEAISPAPVPTLQTAVTMLNDEEEYNEENMPELEIKIPLKVVEEYEIEEMINVYDNARLSESNPEDR